MSNNVKTVSGGTLAACAALAAFLAVLHAQPAIGAQPPAASDPTVIPAWNAIAVSTIAGPAPNGAGKANVEAFLWFAFVQAAVYNAVNGITGEYELYEWNAKAPKGASPQAAAAVAAHGVLIEYFGSGDFPNSEAIAANLNAALATSLGQIPDGVPKDQGIRYGGRAAERIVELRSEDGRFAPIVFDRPLAPGVWRPTPPAMAPFFDPWLGQVDPFVLNSSNQFDPGPPPSIASDLYVEEFEEVRDYGVNVGSLRSAQQTQTALFFSDVGVGALQAGLRDLVTRRGLDISDSARLFAAVDLSMADGAIAVWNAKFHYGWWRPITAIREADADGNPDTAGVPGWTPLIVTPPYPDWPSGTVRRLRCGQHGPRTAECGRPGRSEPHVGRGGRYAALRHRCRHPAGRDRRARLLRHSLPNRRRSRHGDGHTGGELGPRPPLRARELDATNAASRAETPPARLRPYPRPVTVISLMVAVPDAAAAVDWYRRALGASELWNLGSVVGLEIEGAPFFLAEPESSHWDSPAQIGTTTVRIEVFVDDPDSFVARAVEAGADGSSDPVRDHDAPWGTHRQGGFYDPFGHVWLVGDKSPLRRLP